MAAAVGPIFFPTLEDIEEICYPQACAVFTDPEYFMPPLKWHDKGRMAAALGAVANSPLDSIPAIAAHLAYYTTKNHPFVDGNKRMTVILLLSFLTINHWNPLQPITKDELVTFIEKVSGSPRENKEHTLELIERWVRKRFSPGVDEPWYVSFFKVPREVIERVWSLRLPLPSMPSLRRSTQPMKTSRKTKSRTGKPVRPKRRREATR